MLQIKILKRHGDPKTASPGHHSSSSPSGAAVAAAATTGGGGGSGSGSGGGGSGSSRKHKSLAEREADYASARARILGSDYKPGGGGSGESAGAVTIAPVVNPSSGSGGASPRSEAGVKRQPRYVIRTVVIIGINTQLLVLCSLIPRIPDLFKIVRERLKRQGVWERG